MIPILLILILAIVFWNLDVNLFQNFSKERAVKWLYFNIWSLLSAFIIYAYILLNNPEYIAVLNIIELWVQIVVCVNFGLLFFETVSFNNTVAHKKIKKRKKTNK